MLTHFVSVKFFSVTISVNNFENARTSDTGHFSIKTSLIIREFLSNFDTYKIKIMDTVTIYTTRFI